MTALARVAEHCRPALLTLLLIALLTSITGIGILTALLALTTLARLTDADARARYRLPLAIPILAFVLVSLASALVSEHRSASLLYLRHLHLIALFFIAANEFRSGAEIRRALWWFGATVVVASLYAMLQTLVCTTSVAVPEWVAWALKLRLSTCRQPSVEPFRAKGFFSIYMTLGGSLVVALALLLGAVVLGTERRRPAIQSAFAVIALGLTYVRNAWLGLGAVLVVLVVLSRRWILVAGAAAIVALVLLVPSPAAGEGDLDVRSGQSERERAVLLLEGGRAHATGRAPPRSGPRCGEDRVSGLQGARGAAAGDESPAQQLRAGRRGARAPGPGCVVRHLGRLLRQGLAYLRPVVPGAGG